MNPAMLQAVIQAAGGAWQAAPQVIDQFNTWFGGVNEVQSKVRWLGITVVNMSTQQELVMEDNWFDSGRFWSTPFNTVQPGCAITFFVCDRDGSVFTGVSGGVGFRVRPVYSGYNFEDGEGSWWICTFSNPYAGSIKCLTRWKGFGIRPLWEEMDQAAVVRDRCCACYMKEDKHIVFLWKDPYTPW